MLSVHVYSGIDEVKQDTAEIIIIFHAVMLSVLFAVTKRAESFVYRSPLL